MTVPALAVAERGTLVLATGPGHGRSIDVVSMHHLAILPASRLRATLGEALTETYAPGRRRRPCRWCRGPAARPTSRRSRPWAPTGRWRCTSSWSTTSDRGVRTRDGTPIIRLDHVSKRFGENVAVNDVSFEVRPGRCLGWLGPNGSGKTTFVRCILGLARVSSGAIEVRGHPIPAGDAGRWSGWARSSRSRASTPTSRARGNLEVWARFTGGEAHGRIAWALERVNLTARADSAVKQYSLGMRQRLGVARSLLTDPELLILDEPDQRPRPRRDRRVPRHDPLVRREDGRTVFVSSHLLDEVQKLADDIAIVQAGRLVMHGPVDELVAGGAARSGCGWTPRAREARGGLGGDRGRHRPRRRRGTST